MTTKENDDDARRLRKTRVRREREKERNSFPTDICLLLNFVTSSFFSNWCGISLRNLWNLFSIRRLHLINFRNETTNEWIENRWWWCEEKIFLVRTMISQICRIATIEVYRHRWWWCELTKSWFASHAQMMSEFVETIGLRAKMMRLIIKQDRWITRVFLPTDGHHSHFDNFQRWFIFSLVRFITIKYMYMYMYMKRKSKS